MDAKGRAVNASLWSIPTDSSFNVDDPCHFFVPCVLTGRAEWWALNPGESVRSMKSVEARFGNDESFVWISPRAIFAFDEPFRAIQFAWQDAPEGWLSISRPEE